MRVRRLIVLFVAVILLLGLHRAALVFGTSARALGHSGLVFWSRSQVTKTSLSVLNMDADEYTSPGGHRASILLIHGVNESGKNSPEVKPIAEAFAGAGFRIVVPQFERLTRQNVTPADVDDIVAAFSWLGEDAGMMCASYGCGPAIIAAGRPEIRDHVRFIVVFGGYFDLKDQLRHVITDQADPSMVYSKWRYMNANADLLSTEKERRELSAVADERG